MRPPILVHKREFALFFVVVGAIAAVPYIYTIFKGHRPPYSTYLGWLLIGSTGFIFHYQAISAENEKWSAFLPALYIFIPLTYLLLLVFLRAKWELDRRDKACPTGIALCWVVWVISHFFHHLKSADAACRLSRDRCFCILALASRRISGGRKQAAERSILDSRIFVSCKRPPSCSRSAILRAYLSRLSLYDNGWNLGWLTNQLRSSEMSFRSIFILILSDGMIV